MNVGRLRIPAPALDWGFALALCAVFLVASVLGDARKGPLWLAIASALAMTLPLAARRRHALVVELVVAAVVIPQAAWLVGPYVAISPLLPLLIAAYAAGAYERGRASAAGAVVALATPVAIAAAIGSDVWGDYVFPAIIIGLGWLGGWLVRSRTELAARLHEDAVRAEDERERLAELAVADERRRIARELHDIVAHSMSVMVVQAGGARRILDRDPARAGAAAAQIEATGREALAEMRRLLGVLRVDVERAPQPGMEQLGALVERARDAGLPVELRVEGDARPLPAGVDLAGYRIVQEALTNTLKHAGAAPTTVHVRYGDDAVELEVADRGRAAAAPAPVGPEPSGPGDAALVGHGLIGMRERVRVTGGELHAGPSAGGFVVTARLPIARPGTATAHPRTAAA